MDSASGSELSAALAWMTPRNARNLLHSWVWSPWWAEEQSRTALDQLVVQETQKNWDRAAAVSQKGVGRACTCSFPASWTFI